MHKAAPESAKVSLTMRDEAMKKIEVKSLWMDVVISNLKSLMDSIVIRLKAR